MVFVFLFEAQYIASNANDIDTHTHTHGDED